MSAYAPNSIMNGNACKFTVKKPISDAQTYASNAPAKESFVNGSATHSAAITLTAMRMVGRYPCTTTAITANAQLTADNAIT